MGNSQRIKGVIKVPASCFLRDSGELVEVNLDVSIDEWNENSLLALIISAYYRDHPEEMWH